jgi:hypothetical protein
LAINLSTTGVKESYKYVPLIEKDNSENPFSVKFKKLDLKTLASIKDESITVKADSTFTVNTNTQYYLTLRESLLGWENLNNGGDPVQFKKDADGVTDETLEFLPAELRAEIAQVIIDVSDNPSKASEILK